MTGCSATTRCFSGCAIVLICILLFSCMWLGAKVSYVSRWLVGVPPSTPSHCSTVHSSGYCSNCSDLHDTKTPPLRLVDMRRRRQSTGCTSGDDVIKRMMTSSNKALSTSSRSQQQLQATTVKHELDLSMQVST